MDNGIAIGGCDRDVVDACDAIADSLIPTSGFTMAAWVKVEDMIGQDQSFYQTWSADGAFVTHGQLQQDGQIRMKLRGQLQADNINSGDRWFTDGVGGTDPYPLDEWFHIVTTYSQPSDEIKFYYNGNLVVDQPADGNAGPIELGDWGQAAVIGIVPDTRGRQFYGRLDEYYVFHRAITAEEVGLLYNLVEPGPVVPKLQAGDANQDLKFDQFDLIKVQQAAKYLTGQAASWGEGDWDTAPGGSQGSPPAGNGRFDQLDIIQALNNGLYLKGPYAALAPGGSIGDGQTSIIYNPATGEVGVDAPAGVQLTSVNIDSAGRVFTGAPAQNLGGSFDNDADNNIFKATFGSSFGSLSFGNVAQAGLSQQFVLADLTAVGSLAGGGALGNVDLVYVPEPSTWLLLSLGLVSIVAGIGRRWNLLRRN